MFCTNCGNKHTDENAVHCSICGAKQNKASSAPPKVAIGEINVSKKMLYIGAGIFVIVVLFIAAFSRGGGSGASNHALVGRWESEVEHSWGTTTNTREFFSNGLHILNRHGGNWTVDGNRLAFSTGTGAAAHYFRISGNTLTIYTYPEPTVYRRVR